MGVSGSGKSTIGKKLSVKAGLPFFDADDFHPPANKAKMKAGKALTDEDRQGWLLALNGLALQQQHNGAVIACSALKESYRTILSRDVAIPVYWIYLKGDFDLIAERMKQRKDHFMPPELLVTQFQTLELPIGAIEADITQSPDSIVEMIMGRLSAE